MTTKSQPSLTHLSGFNELGMCMDPPTGGVEYSIPEFKDRKLMTRNTGVYFFLDEEDFHTCKNVQWFEWKDQIVTKEKVPVDQYLGIRGRRRDEAAMFDYRRSAYYA